MLQNMILLANTLTVGLCIILKLPQIVEVYRSRSGRGISLSSVILEWWGYMTIFSYSCSKHYAFMLYAEYFFLVIQDVFLLALLLSYSNRLNIKAYFPLSILCLIQIQLALGTLADSLSYWLIMLCIPISASSKVIQFFAILKSKDSGRVSLVSWILAATTSALRILTTLLETRDLIMLLNLTVSLILNSLVVWATLKYRRKTHKE